MPEMYEGVPCPTHGIRLRMRKNRQCRECFLEGKRRWAKKRICRKDLNDSRSTQLILATPPWANLKAIKEIYREARSKGLTVDHVIPLRGAMVCGLHVENNLQLLTQAENDSKGNKFEVV